MHVPIQHIIGTITLIGLVISAGLAYSLITFYFEADIYTQQLRQVSDYVALNLVELVNLGNFSKTLESSTNAVIKSLNLPLDIGGKAYAINLTQNYQIIAYLIAQPSTKATSSLSFQSGQCDLELTEKTYDSKSGAITITSYSTIYGDSALNTSGRKNTNVVWVWKGSGTLIAGIGRITSIN